MANIKVKNNAGTEVIYNNIDQIVMPTADGGTAVFKRWNGAPEVQVFVSLHNLNIMKTITVADAPTITAELVLT